MGRKIVFLDFDGPIIPSLSWRRTPGFGSYDDYDEVTAGYMIDDGRVTWHEPTAWPPCIKELNRITDKTGAKIVVSSAWRAAGYEAVRDDLKRWGATAEVIDITPCGFVHSRTYGKDAPLRGEEIQQWLDANPDVKSFVIFDDDNDMAHLRPYLVLTPMSTGITRELADRAIRILEREREFLVESRDYVPGDRVVVDPKGLDLPGTVKRLRIVDRVSPIYTVVLDDLKATPTGLYYARGFELGADNSGKEAPKIVIDTPGEWCSTRCLDPFEYVG